MPRHERSGQPLLWLPPRDARQWDEEREEKFDTPLDSNGLVDLDKLVTLGKHTVHADYDWTSRFNDIHHLQWPGIEYRSEIAQPFRELTRRKAYIPRKFHNWLHHITLPPLIPTDEVMRSSIRAERAARALATTAELAVKLTRNPHIPEVKLQQRLEEEFDLYSLYVENARLIPKEFQIIRLAEVEAKNVDEMLAANQKLGKWALHRVPIRHRELGTTAA